MISKDEGRVFITNHGYGQFPATVPVTVTVTRCVRGPFRKSTLIGEKIVPVVALKVTVFGIAPVEGITVKPVPVAPLGPAPEGKVLNVPLPATETLPDPPQAIDTVSGVTVNEAGVGVTVSPLAPRTAFNADVSIVRPVASVTINATFPHPLTCAVNLPPLVPTAPGVTDATAGSGDTPVYGGVPPKM